MCGSTAPTRAASVNRRNALKGAAGAAAAAVAVGVRETAQAAEAPGPTPASGHPQNPYGGGANTGIGSTPVPPTRVQAGTAIMVELGNGKRFRRMPTLLPFGEG